MSTPAEETFGTFAWTQKQAREGRIKLAPVYEGSHLPDHEQQRIRDMSPEERLDYSMRHLIHPTGDIETTGQDLWDANGGSSPHQDEAERNSKDVFQLVTDENGNLIHGVLRHKPTDREMSMEVVKAIQTVELAGIER